MLSEPTIIVTCDYCGYYEEFELEETVRGGLGIEGDTVEDYISDQMWVVVEHDGEDLHFCEEFCYEEWWLEGNPEEEEQS